jgi:hypothetical protein
MKFIMKVTIPNKHGNDLLKDPKKFGNTMHELLEGVKAEAAYFTTFCGNRGGYIVVNLDDASQLPAVAEPFFFALHAEIDWFPVMTPEDLAMGLPAVEAAVKKWAK